MKLKEIKQEEEEKGDEEALGRKKMFKKGMLTWHPMWQSGKPYG